MVELGLRRRQLRWRRRLRRLRRLRVIGWPRPRARPTPAPARSLLPPGAALGWRMETAWLIEQHRAALPFTEVVAESIRADRELPPALAALRAAGTPIVPHGVSLSLGSGEPPDRGRLRRLARLAARLDAPLVSEHIAFVRGGGHETEHLLPVPRTRAALDVVVDNVRRAQDALPVPLALENIAALFRWPGPQLPEAEFLAELLDRTGALLLLDLANLHANAENFAVDPAAFLDTIPLDRLAYVHVAGGVRRDGFYHDTHAHPLTAGPLALLAALVARLRRPVPVLLERDDGFPDRATLEAELEAVRAALAPATIGGAAEHAHVG
jgi:uncharacterized protein